MSLNAKMTFFSSHRFCCHELSSSSVKGCGPYTPPMEIYKEIYTQAYKCEKVWKYDDLHAIYTWHNTGSNMPLVVIALPKQKSQFKFLKLSFC
jgi:hypothetical protein